MSHSCHRSDPITAREGIYKACVSNNSPTKSTSFFITMTRLNIFQKGDIEPKGVFTCEKTRTGASFIPT